MTHQALIGQDTTNPPSPWRIGDATLEYYERNDDLDAERYVDYMEFRLVYEGSLKATTTNNARVADKHAIRKQFHRQLVEFWDRHPGLLEKKTYIPTQSDKQVLENQADGIQINDPGATVYETLARQFSRCGFRFVPLVNKSFNAVCGLTILFLRRDNPGNLILPGGDIDNRIKTLLDALRVPENGSELPPNCVPEADEDPFCCLLENDSLVTELNVTTDRLLSPLKDSQRQNDVFLIIQVKVKTLKLTWENMNLL